MLVSLARPFEIGNGDLAVGTGLQRLQKFLGDDGLRVTLALDREFIHVHRIGDIDGENQFDIDRGRGVLVRRMLAKFGPWTRRGDTRDVAARQRPRPPPRPRPRPPRPPPPPPPTSTAPIETHQRISGPPVRIMRWWHANPRPQSGNIGASYTFKLDGRLNCARDFACATR